MYIYIHHKRTLAQGANAPVSTATELSSYLLFYLFCSCVFYVFGSCFIDFLIFSIF